MRVIKFGGSSLSSSRNILKVINIIKQYDDKTVIVLSAFGKTTNNIITSGELASKKNRGYKDIFKKIESYHFDIIRGLVDINFQVKILTEVQKKFLNLENILDGIYGVGELSKSILDKISSFGELLSSYIFYEITKYNKLDSEFLDSRKIIFTKKTIGNNIFIDFAKTKKNLEIAIKKINASYLIFPGFIASDYLNKDILIGLAIINPIYFICMMIGAMKTIQISLSVILGTFLGPVFYFISPEWCILLGGIIAGSVAYLIGESTNDK